MTAGAKFLRQARVYLLSLSVILCVCAIATFVIDFFKIPNYLFPTPYAVAVDLLENFDYLVSNMLYTLFEATAGLFCSTILGLLVGILSLRSTRVRTFGNHLAIVFQTVPLVAIAPLMVIWVGPGPLSKIILAAIVGSPPMLLASIQGFQAAPRELVTCLRVMGCDRWQIFRAVNVPYAFREIATGLRLSASLNVIGAIIAEYAGSTNGIGYVIMQSSYRLDIVKVFAAVLLAVLSGWLLVRATDVLKSLMFRLFGFR